MFFTAYSLHSLKLFQFKTEEQTILTKKLTKKLQNYNQNSHSSRVSLIALALNNTANQNGGQPLYNRRYCTKTLNFPIMRWECASLIAQCFLWHDIKCNALSRYIMKYSTCHLCFLGIHPGLRLMTYSMTHHSKALRD